MVTNKRFGGLAILGLAILGIFVATKFLGGSVSEAHAGEECSPEQIQKTASELMVKVQQLAQTDPSKMTEMISKLTDAATRFQGDNWQEACDYYAELSKDLEVGAN